MRPCCRGGAGGNWLVLSLTSCLRPFRTPWPSSPDTLHLRVGVSPIFLVPPSGAVHIPKGWVLGPQLPRDPCNEFTFLLVRPPDLLRAFKGEQSSFFGLSPCPPPPPPCVFHYTLECAALPTQIQGCQRTPQEAKFGSNSCLSSRGSSRKEGTGCSPQACLLPASLPQPTGDSISLAGSLL